MTVTTTATEVQTEYTYGPDGYPHGSCMLCQWGPTWNWYCCAKLYPDGTADILLHDRLHKRDHAEKITAIEIDGGFEIVENGDRDRIANELIVHWPGHEQRAHLYQVRNKGNVFSYPRF
jgi:hypothetical protein